MQGMIKALTAATLGWLLAGCGWLDPGIDHACTLSGERFRYQDGKRLGEAGIANLKFSLTTYRWRHSYSISGVETIPELANPQVLLDKSRSNSAESVYLLDQIDATSKERTVSSLVLNQVSGDTRIAHRRWLPPAEWQNSDQYSYSGHCKRLQAIASDCNRLSATSPYRSTAAGEGQIAFNNSAGKVGGHFVRSTDVARHPGAIVLAGNHPKGPRDVRPSSASSAVRAPPRPCRAGHAEPLRSAQRRQWRCSACAGRHHQADRGR
jgi:hypothetical protein